MTKEQIIEISQFLKDHILECELGTGCGRCDELRKHINSLDLLALQPEQKELSLDEIADEGIKYLQEKYPDKKILQLPDIKEGPEFIDFVMGMQIGHDLALKKPEQEPSDEDIEKEANWRFTSGHGASDDYSIGVFTEGAKWRRTKIYISKP